MKLPESKEKDSAKRGGIKKKEKVESMPMSTVLFNYDTTSLKCLWALSD